MKTVFVILHYLTLDDTVACVASLQHNLATGRDDDLEIVIVDNGSPNQSGEQLAQHFSGQPGIHLLRLPGNEGFARGNNAGYQFAKQHLQPDYIVLLNNDTIIEQADFLSCLRQIDEETGFDVLGPDILTLDGRHQNPKALQGYDPAALARKIARVERNLWLARTGLYALLVMLDHGKTKALPRQTAGSPAQEKPSAPPRIRNCVLHGSCLIFSQRYIQRFKGLYSQTFLYVEEEILWQIAQQELLNLVYSPELKILHLEDRATQATTKNLRRKRIFKLTHELASLRQLQAIQADRHNYQQDLFEPAD
jgi:GT2 family glycosyltransferase